MSKTALIVMVFGAGLAGSVANVFAQSAAESGVPAKRAWNIVPSISIRETFTDNASPGQAGKARDQITEVSPGIRLDGNAARVKMHFDYRLSELYYAQGTRGSQTQHALNSFGTLEAVEKLLFVDVSGNISRQNISAFGVQSPSNYSDNSNSTETSNFRISPYLRGRLGGYADYEARYSRSALRAKSAAASDSDIQEWRGRVSGDTPLAFIGWSAEGSRQSSDYTLGRKTESDNIRGRLTYRVDPQLKLSASIGRESNDYLSLTKQTWNTSGYGADWSPTERTQVSAFREKRFFGNGHTFSVSHRLPRSAIKYVDSRDIASLPNQFATVGLGNIYDLLFSQMASSIPDQDARAVFVNSLLQQSGIAPNTQVNAGFLSSQVTLMRRQELSYVLQGVRNTLTLAANRSRNERLGTGLGTGDDYSSVSDIAQQGFNVGWSHQLSPLSSLNVTGTRSRSTGSSATSAVNPENTQKSLSAGVTTKLGAKTNGALTARRTETSGTNPYTENAVVGSISVQF